VASVLSQIDDPVVTAFWRQEFGAWNDRYRSEAVAPIQNKIGQFLSNPVIRSVVGQANGLLDLRRVMDDGKILIANLSRGRIGEDASMLLGSLLVTGIQQAVMSRSDLLEDRRRDFCLYIDEFQNFATDSFAVILSEARKYRLSLTVAHQYLAQVEEQTQSTVFGSVGSMICFQVGSEDAETLAGQLSRIAGEVSPRDLASTPRHTAYVRLLIDGLPCRPFTTATLPPPLPPAEDRTAVVRHVSQRRYARPADKVHRDIRDAFAVV